MTFSQQVPIKGVPYLENFIPADYSHKGKVWSLDSAPNGILYMAADKGLLEYDGETWRSYKGDEGVIRSVLVVNDSLIYTGSDLDFGVWKLNKFREFEYTSLYPFKEDLNQINEEFWNIHGLKGNIFFVSASNIYVYNERNLTKIAAPNSIKDSYIVNGELFFIDSEEGLFKLEDLSPRNIYRFEEKKVPEVVGMYEAGDDVILVTQNAGLWRYASGELVSINSELSQDLKEASVFSFEEIGDSSLAFGTILKGLYISDSDGNLIHHVNKNKGLQNNTVLSLHHDQSGKLWLSMDYGISFLDLSNEFTFFYDFRGDFGTGYSAELKGRDFYLGTNQGLYRSDWESLNNDTEFNQFELIEGTEGQVWTLTQIEGQMLMGHDHGLFTIENNQARKIGTQRGIWTLRLYEDYLLAGTYNGISIFEKNGADWNFLKKMDLILGSCNQILREGENIIWVNIPNYGVIRATLDENLNPVEREIFLSEEFEGEDHFLVKSGTSISVETETTRHRYDSSRKEFLEVEVEDEREEISDLLLRNAQPELLNDNYEFFPIYNGFALKNLNKPVPAKAEKKDLIFRTVEAYNNESNVKTYQGDEIPHYLNNLRIVSVVPNEEGVEYQFMSEQEGNWSAWTSDNIFELVGLSHGEHTLSARAKVNGNITSAKSITFTINAPWYLSWYMYLIYGLLAISAVYLLYRMQELTLVKQRKDMLKNQRKSLQEQQEKHKKSLQIAEREKSLAEFEQLKAQLKSKTIELATKAKENDEKNQILQKLKRKLEQIEKQPESFKVRSAEIIQIIDSHIEPDDNTFEIQIDELHQQFFDTLRSEFPELTRYDLRLCAYIKIGFNSKEISNMLNIKPSSVYISRSRLRKKLNIETDEDLHSYLNSI